MIAVRSDDLKRALNRVKPYVPRGGTLPILANVLLEVRAGKLWVTATDLDVMVSVPLLLIGEGDSFPAATVNCCALAALVRRSKACTRLWSEGDALLVTPNEDVIAKLAMLPADEFPSTPLSSDATEMLGHFPSAALRAVYQRVVPFTASDKTCPVLQSVRARLSVDEAEFSAADGFKLAILKVEYEGQECEELLVPAKAFAFMRHFQGQASLSWHKEKGSRRAMCKFEDDGGTVLFVSCDTEGYPKLQKVFPRELSTRFMVSIPVWERGVKTIMSSRKKPADERFLHRLRGSTLTIASQDADRLATCRIPVEVLKGEGQARFTLGREHLLPLLGSACGYVEVAFRRSVEDMEREITGPLVFESPGWTALIMPMMMAASFWESYGEAQTLADRLETLAPVEGESSGV